MNNFIESLKTAPGFVCLKPLGGTSVAEAETALGLHFSDEYTAYVTECGVACIQGHELTGVCASKRLNVVDVTLAAREANPATPSNLYVIEEAHIDGILAWQDASGAVYLSKPGCVLKKEADSLAAYLKL